MSTEDKKLRSHLPMRNTVPVRFVPYDAKDLDAVKTPIEQLRPPEGTPNVIIVLNDDCGFGASSAFGGQPKTGCRSRGRIHAQRLTQILAGNKTGSG